MVPISGQMSAGPKELGSFSKIMVGGKDQGRDSAELFKEETMKKFNQLRVDKQLKSHIREELKSFSRSPTNKRKTICVNSNSPRRFLINYVAILKEMFVTLGVDPRDVFDSKEDEEFETTIHFIFTNYITENKRQRLRTGPGFGQSAASQGGPLKILQGQNIGRLTELLKQANEQYRSYKKNGFHKRKKTYAFKMSGSQLHSAVFNSTVVK